MGGARNGGPGLYCSGFARLRLEESFLGNAGALPIAAACRGGGA